jgi:hypothetical protein
MIVPMVSGFRFEDGLELGHGFVLCEIGRLLVHPFGIAKRTPSSPKHIEIEKLVINH